MKKRCWCGDDGWALSALLDLGSLKFEINEPVGEIDFTDKYRKLYRTGISVRHIYAWRCDMPKTATLWSLIFYIAPAFIRWPYAKLLQPIWTLFLYPSEDKTVRTCRPRRTIEGFRSPTCTYSRLEDHLSEVFQCKFIYVSKFHYT